MTLWWLGWLGIGNMVKGRPAHISNMQASGLAVVVTQPSSGLARSFDSSDREDSKRAHDDDREPERHLKVLANQGEANHDEQYKVRHRRHTR